MVNETIRAREVRLIGVNGDQLGVKSKAEAIQIAEEANLDVVKLVQRWTVGACSWYWLLMLINNLNFWRNRLCLK